MRKLKIFTWHVHGNYLYYLSQVPHEFYLPYKPDRSGHYIGRWGSFPWPDNVHEVPVEEVRNLTIDCILFQQRNQYLEDQYRIFTEEQRRLPRIYLEHDPPQEHPTNTRHPVDDPGVLLVHVTPFNDLMWDSNRTPTTVIDHGVLVPADVRYTGELERALAVVNNIRKRGRRLGYDVLEKVRKAIPLDLIGMGAADAGGIGEIGHDRLQAFEARYRLFFNPIRYTSLGLAVCEAMMIGMPVVALATTEMATVVQNGVTGYADTSVAKLIDHMRWLLEDPLEAKRLGDGARAYARERFNIQRFTRDWEKAFALVTERPQAAPSVTDRHRTHPAGRGMT
jgi:glycosyltransferase involved in cell wall biosynthesis